MDLPDMSRHTLKLPKNYSNVNEYTQSLCAFINDYSWILNCHVVDIFVDNVWTTQFPEGWHALADPSICSRMDLLALASRRILPNRNQQLAPWPNTLKEFVERSKKVALPRNPDDEWVVETLSKAPKLDKRLTYGMNPKKLIEVQALSALINNLAESNTITRILDIGAGQGYLDAALVYGYGHTVIGVDDDMVQTCGAKFKAGRTAKRVGVNKAIHRDSVDQNSRELPKAFGQLFHVNRRVEPTETFQTVLNSLVVANTTLHHERLAPPVETIDRETDATWMLIGLHTCGDLAPSTLRQFINGTAKVLCNVGCCYNHITETYTSDNVPLNCTGFPLSKHIRSTHLQLGFSARMTACQATCRWEMDPDGSNTNFKKHWMRAVLQQLIVDELGLVSRENTHNIKVGRLGRKGKFDSQNAQGDDRYDESDEVLGTQFAAYATIALNCLYNQGICDCPLEKRTPEFLAAFGKSLAYRKHEVAALWTLRAMMAEAVESFILLDRFMLLVEADIPELVVRMVPIFKLEDSPRNMAIIAIKT
ncbi:hypothetical protein QVD99_004626 [Batrachochytrium dendrobatidis]|nr:hypothetical protein QVD99_004626 [Batrachochytrium dendrobatidis]